MNPAARLTASWLRNLSMRTSLDPMAMLAGACRSSADYEGYQSGDAPVGPLRQRPRCSMPSCRGGLDPKLETSRVSLRTRTPPPSGRDSPSIWRRPRADPRWRRLPVLASRGTTTGSWSTPRECEIALMLSQSVVHSPSTTWDVRKGALHKPPQVVRLLLFRGMSDARTSPPGAGHGERL